MTELGASASMVFAVRLASRLNMSIDDVFDMPLARAISIDTALQVMDGTREVTSNISEEDKNIVKFLSENQEDMLKRFKSMKRF